MPNLTDLTDALSVLQDAVTTLLQAVPAFEGYTVRSETDGEVDDLVARPKGKYSVLTTVAVPDLTRGARHDLRVATLVIEFEEAVKVNRNGTFKTARQLEREAENALVGQAPSGAWSPLEFVDAVTVTQKPTFIRQLRLSTQLLLTAG